MKQKIRIKMYIEVIQSFKQKWFINNRFLRQCKNLEPNKALYSKFDGSFVGAMAH
jgi:hypothetical protein